MWSEGKKSARFHCNYLFWENGPFLVPIQWHSQSPNTTKIGLQQAQGKTQNGTFGCKSAILGRASKGALLSVIPKAVFCRKYYFYSVFSKRSFEDMKECNVKKTYIYQSLVVCQKAKRCFLVCFLFFWCFLLFLCVFVLLFCKKAQNGYFPAILEVFVFYFVPPKRLVFNPSFLPVQFYFFPFVFPFKVPFFFVFLSINPFLEHIILGGGYFSFSCVSFPNVCLVLWNKLS